MNDPKLVQEGTCSNAASLSNKETLTGTSWTMATCNAQCNTRTWCTNFVLGKGSKAGECHLYETGCTIGTDTEMDYYEKLAVPSNTLMEYSSSATLVTQQSAFFGYFRNEHSAQCGAITSCEMMVAGCATSYGGSNLQITASTGVVTAK